MGTASVTLSGNDTVIINGRTFTNLADGTVAKLSFPNKLATAKIGKNGNAIIAQNQTGKLAELELRVLRASPDDRFLNGLLNAQVSNFAGFPLLVGEVTKVMGDGGSPTAPPALVSDSYSLSGGYFSKLVEVQENVEGDTNQQVSVWNIEFVGSLTTVPRSIG